jgi:hypothetical protein
MGEGKRRKANTAVRRDNSDTPYRIAHKIVLLIGETGNVSLPAAVDATLLTFTALAASATEARERSAICRDFRGEIPGIVQDAGRLRTKLIGRGEQRRECRLCESGMSEEQAYPEGWEGLSDRIGAELVNASLHNAIEAFRPVFVVLLAQACADCEEMIVEVLKERLEEIPGIDMPYFKLHLVQ